MKHYIKNPDLRMIQLLPIFSVLYFNRHAANDELNFQHDYWQLGLYVGLSPNIPGAIRAAVLINKRHYHYDKRGKWWYWRAEPGKVAGRPLMDCSNAQPGITPLNTETAKQLGIARYQPVVLPNLREVVTE